MSADDVGMREHGCVMNIPGRSVPQKHLVCWETRGRRALHLLAETRVGVSVENLQLEKPLNAHFKGRYSPFDYFLMAEL